MVDEKVFVDKLRHINRYTADLRQMQDVPEQEYLNDVVIQRAVERTLMNLIQGRIDLAQHVRSTEGLSPSGTAKREMEALEVAVILSTETRERMEEAVGFRNVLAHQYGNIDHEIVYEVLRDDLHWFERFQQEPARWFQQHHS
ncbi:DUF86 domain-containing protein [Halomarina halobia]|uniref:DUF86 domain-containing protein n=1 Tax=Halomarina halobia TaxID=3033386 RepID=A0ABD6ACS3_9EURY|nr:DUF86 domain-containing protein [Halomarina sp. PSR21]